MAYRVIMIGVVLMVATALIVTRPIQAKRLSKTKSSQSNDPCSPNFECKLPGGKQRRRLDQEGVDSESNLEDCQSRCSSTILRGNEKSKRQRKVEEECQCFCLQFHNASCPTTAPGGTADPEAAFPCLDNELDSCRLKRRTLNRLPVEDLQNADNQGACQDRCQSASGKRGKRLEQCNCLCNYYSICDSGGSGEELRSGSGNLKDEKATSKSKKSLMTKSKTNKSRKQ